MVEGVVDSNSEEHVLLMLPVVELMLQILLLHIRHGQLSVSRVRNNLQFRIGKLRVQLNFVIRKEDELTIFVLENINFNFEEIFDEF